MKTPTLVDTTARGETFAGVTYHLDGELVPVLAIDLTPGNSVYFEHHILLWKNTTVEIGVRSLKGAFKRMMAGMQIMITEATGHGQIAFSRDGAGHVFALHLSHNQEIHVREHQFLAATGNVDYTFERVKGVSNMLAGGTGFFIDRFKAANSDGIVWLHGYGNIFEVTLAAGESLDIEPGGWVYKDPSVRMESNFQRLSTGFMAGMNLVMNRFTGPGRVGIQSMYLHLETAD